MSWIARRVSASMSRLVCASSSSRRALASARVSCSLVSAALRARARIASACSRAAASRSRYSSSRPSASARVLAAVSSDSSMMRWRRSSASAICGKAYFFSSQPEIPKTSSVQTISPTSGETRKLPPSSAVSAAMTTAPNMIALDDERGQQARDEAVEHARLGQGEAEPLDRGDLVAHLRLARDRLDHVAEDVADADAGTGGTESATHAQGDLAARVGACRGCLCGCAALGDDAYENAHEMLLAFELISGHG